MGLRALEVEQTFKKGGNMTKQELIENVKGLTIISKQILNVKLVDQYDVIKLIEQLDEPQKPVVPQFVANYIEKYKEELSVREAMSKSYATFEVDKWLAELDEDGNFINQNTFAIAWIFGYEVEKEKRYRVKLKNADISYSLLKCNTEGEWWFGVDFDEDSHAHTRKELEEAGFGWVFDCPGIEIEEVE